MEDRGLLSKIRTEELGINAQTLEAVIVLAVEIAREGREGRKVGTLFVVSDTEEVFRRSKPLILDPLLGHAPENKHIGDPNVRETVKELAQLDGAFVVSDDGVFLSAARYINASSEGIELPLGLGSRHMAAASVSKRTNAVAVVVSESSVVRIFDEGQVVSEIIPELWLLRRGGLDGTYSSRDVDQMAVVSKEDES
jgi:DNA integrity scanning protein DisA with diadenylate cyclase activity